MKNSEHSEVERDIIGMLFGESHGVETFMQNHFDSRELFGKRSACCNFSDAIMEDLRSALASELLGAEYVHSLIDGVHQPGFTGPSRLLTTERLTNALEAGHSLRLFGVHNLSETAAAVCGAIGRLMLATVGCNVYISPPKCSAFRVHYDTHDVIVLQLAGKKRWSVFAEKTRTLPELPLKAQGGHEFDAGENLSIEMEVELEPGDALYLPRGKLHFAKSDSSTSVHATFGVEPVTLKQVIDDLITEEALESTLLRSSVALHRGALSSRVSDVLERILSGGAADNRVKQLLAQREHQMDQKARNHEARFRNRDKRLDKCFGPRAGEPS